MSALYTDPDPNTVVVADFMFTGTHVCLPSGFLPADRPTVRGIRPVICQDGWSAAIKCRTRSHFAPVSSVTLFVR